MPGEYVATVTVNRSGRILSADKVFCRMFGFKPEECKWHYICDCVGGVDRWNTIRDNLVPVDTKGYGRRNRSFHCTVTPIMELVDGKHAYRCSIAKKQKH